MHRYLFALLLGLVWLTSVNAADENVGTFQRYAGLYRVSGDHMIGVDPFIMDDGTNAMLISDYSSGVVRRLFPAENDEFVMGAEFNSATPVELTARFVLDPLGNVKGMSFRQADGKEQVAERVPLNKEEVTFQGVDARLNGTLILPPAKRPRPAIILLHGSGPLTRYSFGPYPHFFSSLGMAVLIYDKRGTGKSTGVRMDASTGTAMREARYPDELAGDALAAMRLLEQRDDIDPKRIGFWGSSEGGMLATQVAARSKNVAFAINSSGFMEPLWQTLRYQVGAIRGSAGVPEADIARETTFIDLWLRVARTGEGWEEFRKAEQELIAAQGSWIFRSRGPFTSLEQLRWDWDHILSFDPTLALANVKCPVLGVFGELDVLTPAARTAENMRLAFEKAGHKDFTFKIFPSAGHSLGEQPARRRMAPGVFDTLRDWLRARVQ
ncbi:MAG: alpha/beta fold hydrolase [Steroidobacter sp.]